MDLLWQKDYKKLYADVFNGVSTKKFDSYSKALAKTTEELAALKFNQKK